MEINLAEIYPDIDNDIEGLKRLTEYVRGLANNNLDKKLHCAADWLENTAENICGQGYFGCHCGKYCSSDHK